MTVELKHDDQHKYLTVRVSGKLSKEDYQTFVPEAEKLIEEHGKVRILVATDIAARGLDIDKLPHVVNFELPNIPEDYVHRIGRTASAGEEGNALSLVCSEEIGLLKDIEKLLKTRLERVVMPGYEPSANPPRALAEPSRQSRPGAAGQQRRSHGNSAPRPAGRGQPRRANGY